MQLLPRGVYVDQLDARGPARSRTRFQISGDAQGVCCLDALSRLPDRHNILGCCAQQQHLQALEVVFTGHL